MEGKKEGEERRKIEKEEEEDAEEELGTEEGRRRTKGEINCVNKATEGRQRTWTKTRTGKRTRT